jgi:hypothetical protein
MWPYTIHEPRGDVSPANFYKLVAAAGKAATLYGLMAIAVGDFVAQPVGHYLDKTEPVEENPKFTVSSQHGRNIDDALMTAKELLKKLKTTDAGPEPMGAPAIEVAAAEAHQGWHS